MLRLRYNKAQSTAEYVIVLGLIVAAVVAMQSYIKRGFQGRIKDAVDFKDQAGQNANVVQFNTTQYEPYYLTSTFESTRNSEDNEHLSQEGAVNREVGESSQRIGNQVIGAAQAQGQ